MTSIIVGQNISGSLTSTSPTIVDPTSPFNGQFYDDFDVSSVNAIDPNNLPFLLAASKELGDIGSVKIGEVRSTNIFIQPPAGSAPGASTVIQLINTNTNSVDAQATSSGSEALQFVKNAEIVGTDYKVRIINAIPGDYQISLAGAIQSVQVVGSGSTTATPIDPNAGAKLASPGGGISGSNGSNPPGQGSSTPVISEPTNPDATAGSNGSNIGGQGSGIPVISEPTNPGSTAGSNGSNPPGQGSGIPVISEPTNPGSTAGSNGSNPPGQGSSTPVISEPINPGSTSTPPKESIPLVFVEAPLPTTPIGDQPTPIRVTTPAPNERTVDVSNAPTDPIINPTLTEIDPRIFQNAVGSIPPGVLANAGGGLPQTAPVQIDVLDSNGGLTSGGFLQESVFPNIVLNNNFLTTKAATGFGISAISQKPGGKVSEIGIFAVDDATGKIGGIAPGAPGYLQAIGDSARSIFSTLGGSFFSSANKREISLDPNKIYGFFEVQDGSIADIKQQLLSGKTPTNILSSLPDANGIVPIKVTNNSTTGGYNVSINNNELVLNVVQLDGATPNIPIGAKSQGLAEGRTIDLTAFAGQALKVDITTKSDAGYTNNIGFYAVEDSIGTIKLADGTTVKPGDVKYALEAVKSALTNSSLQAGKTASKLGQDITGGKIYAPVVVSQGSLSDFIANNPTNIGGNSNNAYFNYVLGNADKQDHFRLIGDNTFGVEDQFGGGDRDFNDLVVNMNVKQA